MSAGLETFSKNVWLWLSKPERLKFFTLSLNLNNLCFIRISFSIFPFGKNQGNKDLCGDFSVSP